jgi:uncharacterized protein YndB with AHSA1/START domain
MRAVLAVSLCLVPSLLAAAARQTEPVAPRMAPDVEPLVTEGVVQAPVAEIWRVFTTGEGYKALGVAKAEIDLRPGGLIRSTYDAAKPLDGDAAIQTEILAYEPMRMIATRIHRPPNGFPFKEAWRSVWTVVSLADLGGGRTNVRVAMMGYGQDPESQSMREFFRNGNAWVLKTLQSHFGATPPPPGPAHAENSLAPVDVNSVIQADHSAVWRALATAQGWQEFMRVQAHIGAQPGEPFEVFFDPKRPAGERGSEGCRVLSLVPGEMISFSWNAPPRFAFVRKQRTWVVVMVQALSATTTRVHLREMGFVELAARYPEHRGEIEAARAYLAAAWPQVLAALSERFGEPVAHRG